jgi:dTMP kinase
MAARGKFITLEGGEGVGKSTQVKALAAALRDRCLEVVETREPGGSPGAERIRDLLLGEGTDWSPLAEALLFAAARADHIETLIEPALARGAWVLCDRFVDSSLAYQGAAGGLGIEQVRAINAHAIGEHWPDRTLVLTTSEGSARAHARDGATADRIGGRSQNFHRLVDQAFRDLAAREPRRVHLVDASGSPEEVTARLLETLEDLFP